MISKEMRLKLARLLKLYKEVSTDNGTLVAESDEFEVGTEVFIISTETGDVQPAPDGEYADASLIYKVENGVIVAITTPKTDTPIVETPVVEENVEEPVVEEPVVEEPVVEQENELLKENEELKTRIAQLEQENEELKQRIAEFEEKANEVEETPEELEKQENFSSDLPKGKMNLIQKLRK